MKLNESGEYYVLLEDGTNPSVDRRYRKELQSAAATPGGRRDEGTEYPGTGDSFVMGMAAACATIAGRGCIRAGGAATASGLPLGRTRMRERKRCWRLAMRARGINMIRSRMRLADD